VFSLVERPERGLGLGGVGRSFEDGFEWKVGDGKEISFWEDRWLGCGAMKRVFPRLFSICSAEKVRVADLGYWSDGVWVWQLAWRRPFFEWEKPMVDQLSQALLEARMVLGEEDRWVWKGGGDQLFSVNSAYSLVRRDCEADHSPIFRKLWSCKAVPSALFTAWRVMKNKIATRVNLERRGVLLKSILCCLCGKEEESYRHLFFDCIFGWRVWCFCFKWLRVSFVSHNDPKSNFAQFRMNTSFDLINEV